MMNPGDYRAPDDVRRWRTLTLGIGGIGVILWAVGAYFNTEQAMRSWLLGFIFWSGIGLGCIGLLVLQYLTGGSVGSGSSPHTRSRDPHAADNYYSFCSAGGGCKQSL